MYVALIVSSLFMCSFTLIILPVRTQGKLKRRYRFDQHFYPKVPIFCAFNTTSFGFNFYRTTLGKGTMPYIKIVVYRKR